MAPAVSCRTPTALCRCSKPVEVCQAWVLELGLAKTRGRLGKKHDAMSHTALWLWTCGLGYK